MKAVRQILGALLALVVLGACVRDEPPAALALPSAAAASSSAARPVSELALRAGDPENGRRLHAIHCAPCHGPSGAGDGPAAPYLHPAPADHTDSAAMASRSDEALFRAIRLGGTAVERSPLMPRFDDRFDDSEIHDLVAHLRTLHRDARSIFGEPVVVERRTVVLEPAGPRVDFLAAPDGRTAIVAGGRALVAAADGRVERVDPAGSEAGALALADRLERARDQAQRDLAEAERLHAAYQSAPDSLSPAQLLFARSCAPCHGMTGKAVGSGREPAAVVPPSLADGERLNRLSNERLQGVIALGGAWARVSGAMPAYGETLSPEEIELLVSHVRSMAVPPLPEPDPVGAR